MLIYKNPAEVKCELAQRCKALRLYRELTQVEMAERAGIALQTYRRFEYTGDISLERFFQIVQVLGRMGEFEELLKAPALKSLSDLPKSKQRQRGRRQS